MHCTWACSQIMVLKTFRSIFHGFCSGTHFLLSLFLVNFVYPCAFEICSTAFITLCCEKQYVVERIQQPERCTDMSLIRVRKKSFLQLAIQAS